MASEIIDVDSEADEDFLDSASSVDSIYNPNLMGLDQICRACESSEVVTDLAEKVNYNLLLKFRACVDIEVDILDPLPSQLCSGCVNNIEFFYKFKIKCEYVDQKLRDIILMTEVDGHNQLPSPTHHMIEEDQEPGVKKQSDTDAVFCDLKLLIEESKGVQAEETQESGSMCSLSYREEDIIYDAQNVGLELQIETLEDNFEDLVQEVSKQKLDNKTPPAKLSARSTNKKIITTYKYKTAKRKTITTTYKCETCHKAFGQAAHLHQHIKSHGKKRYKCEHCDQWFFYRCKYKLHLKTHDSDFEKKDYVCHLCAKVYSNPGNLHRHIRAFHENRKGYDCKVCGQSFARKSILEEHQFRHMEERNFECDTCQKRFHTLKRLNTHKDIHLPNELRMKRPKVPKQSFLCTVCGKHYASMAQLRSHMRCHTGERPFECEFCHKRVRTQQSLNFHLRVHTGEKPFKCEECGMSFRQKGHLKGHMLTHTGQKNYFCNVCSKSFALNSNLTVHMRMHTGETPYKCKYCPHAFYCSNGLKRHTQIHLRNRDPIMVKEVANDTSTMDGNVGQETDYEEEYFISEEIVSK